MASARSAAVATPGTRPRRRHQPAEAPKARPKPKSTPTPAAKPRAGSRARSKQRARSRGGILWIVIGALLLAGVVFVNLAVLQLNLRLDRATQERSKLRADNATLQSQLSAALASPRIQAQARKQDGLVEADPSTIGYLNLRR